MSPNRVNALYEGDNGLLPDEARRVLVQLLSGPSLDGRRHPKLWPALHQHQDIIRSRLSDLFLDLVLDDVQQVAFTRQAETGDLEAPILLRRVPLTFLQSVLLLFLRQLLVQAESRAERAVVSYDEMLEQLKLYDRGGGTDGAGFAKRVNAAIEQVKICSILGRIRGSEDRYEISPTLKLLFGPEEIASLTHQYAALREQRAQEDA